MTICYSVLYVLEKLFVRINITYRVLVNLMIFGEFLKFEIVFSYRLLNNIIP